MLRNAGLGTLVKTKNSIRTPSKIIIIIKKKIDDGGQVFETIDSNK